MPADPMPFVADPTGPVIAAGYEFGRVRFDVTIQGSLHPQVESHACYTLPSDAYCSFSIVYEAPKEAPEPRFASSIVPMLVLLIMLGEKKSARRS